MNDNRYAQEILLDILEDKWFDGYYSPKTILKNNTPYMLTMGGRNIGKTFSYIICIIALWQLADKRSCIMRRYDGSVKKLDTMFSKVLSMGYVPNKKGYDGITFRKRAWCGFWKDGSKTLYDTPFCYTYAMGSATELQKGTLDIEDLMLVLFDEALTNEGYLPDEFIKFTNAISTIVRNNSKACVVLCANTVSWVAPYFREFGISNVQKIKPGTIKVYKCFQQTAITLEYCKDTIATNRHKKIVDMRFFGFKNSTADMIRTGTWEIGSYQHLTRDILKNRKREIVERSIYLLHGDETLCFEITMLEEFGIIINVRPAPGTDLEKAIRIYHDMPLYSPVQHRKPDTSDNIDRFIWHIYKQEKFFYADNLCGETVKQYIQQVMR